jgi:hypothetical protein
MKILCKENLNKKYDFNEDIKIVENEHLQDYVKVNKDESRFSRLTRIFGTVAN